MYPLMSLKIQRRKKVKQEALHSGFAIKTLLCKCITCRVVAAANARDKLSL